jgi:BirA family biotin operon repressor/biotin-[acetyl-CoA-carboxylase] ligase
MNHPGSSDDARTLRALRSATVHLLPGDLATQLSMPLVAVEKSVASLQDAGFDVESKPGLGVRLKRSPDRILADDLWSRLDPHPLLREIIVFEETSSTNDVALRMGREGHRGGVVVFAERQTSGRGRFGRRWDSADHAGLWFSWLLRPDWPAAKWPLLTTWAGVAVARALETVTNRHAGVKWPNDVQIDGRKVAGILIESASDRQGELFAVAGIGVNVNQASFPPEISPLAISARQAAGRELDRPAVAAAVLAELVSLWNLASENFSAIVADAASRSSLLGRWVRLHVGNEVVEGMAESLDPSGQLLLRTVDGALRSMAAGEVTSHSTPVNTLEM